MMRRSIGVSLAFAAAVFFPGAPPQARAASVSENATHVPGAPVTRRLSPRQYESAVRDVFGPTVTLGGRFEPELRRDGLLAIGAGYVSVTSTGMQQYEAMSRAIATQVVDEKHRDLLIPCKPADAAAPDDVCAGKFLGKVGRALYGRPLRADELSVQVNAANLGARELKDFYSGLGLSLASMLASTEFLFRGENLKPAPDRAGLYDLDAYAKASKLSFFLWNARPDQQLLAAAEKGELDHARGLKKQVERMMASSRLEEGLRAFFTDMLGLDELDSLAKDAVIYPKFDTRIAQDAKEQTLRTILNVVLDQKGDYRDVFVTPKTFLTRRLGAIYGVPIVNNAANGAPEMWQEYRFPEGDPRVGIVSQMSFVALHSPPGRSSPTLRGKAMREVLLCQKVPAPPAAVEFKLVQDTNNPVYRTARARLGAHATNPVCAGCHKIIDPLGLALENFDGTGAYRLTENDVTIDASGALNGVAFNSAAGLGKAMYDSPAATSCMLNRLVSYGLGRLPEKGEEPWVKQLEKTFADGGYRVFDLMRIIATDPVFYKATKPADTTAAASESRQVLK
jgi:hypothetical protein